MEKYLKYLRRMLLVGAIFFATSSVKAQYYQIANQLANTIGPALSGGFNYEGYVDAHYLAGLGNVSINTAGVSTSQGFKYKSWFFMGVGLGVDVAMSHTHDDMSWLGGPQFTSTAVMVPVFTDFRFNVGNQARASFFADLKIGASFLMGNKYLRAGDGYLNNRQYFYLKPAIGVRVPLGNSGNKAVNVGVVYQLLTSNYWVDSAFSNNSVLNSLGATVGFEW